MGYCIKSYSGDNKFNMTKENKVKAFYALNNYGISHKNNCNMRWITYHDFIDGTDLIEVMENLRWELYLDSFGNVTSIEFIGEKLGDDIEIFKIIAEFVEDGSYVTILGEDGDEFRYCFNNGTVKEVRPNITYPDNKKEDNGFYEVQLGNCHVGIVYKSKNETWDETIKRKFPDIKNYKVYSKKHSSILIKNITVDDFIEFMNDWRNENVGNK